MWTKQCAHLGKLVRYADDFVVMCDTAEASEEAERRVRIILDKLKLQLHPEKTRRVDLTEGREGFDFLGCHLHKRVSGRLLERGIRRYYLHRWPSKRSMGRVRQRVKDLTGRDRDGVPERLPDGTATSSTTTGSTACAGPSATPARANAALRQTAGKPCAGNPHARFERGF